MVFQTLSSHPELWSLYRESHSIFDRWFPTKLEPGCSSQVTADDVDAATAQTLQREFFESVGNLESEGPPDRAPFPSYCGPASASRFSASARPGNGPRSGS